MTSRFHIVKIDTGPHKRGRWTCQDREEPTNVTSSTTLTSLDSAGGFLASSSLLGGGSSGTNSSRSSSHGAAVPCADDAALSPLSEVGEASPSLASASASAIVGVEDAHDGFLTARDSPMPPSSKFVVTGVSDSARKVPPANMTLASGADVTNTLAPSSGVAPNNAVVATNLGASPSSAFVRVQPQRAILPTLNDQLYLSAQQCHQQGLVTQTTTDITPDSAAVASALLGGILPPSGSTSVPTAVVAAADAQVAEPATSLDGTLAIDNKIEQAMDLVKTHLRYAVREEVEVFRQRIQELEKYVENLAKENKLLRECVPPEILAQLRILDPQQQPILSHGGAAGPSTYAAHPTAGHLMGQATQPTVFSTGQTTPATGQTSVQATQPVGQTIGQGASPHVDSPVSNVTPSQSHSPPQKYPTEQPVPMPSENGPVPLTQTTQQVATYSNNKGQ